MKKIKLLTTLTSLGAIATTAPIVATSCSNNSSKIVADDSTAVNCTVYPNDNELFTFSSQLEASVKFKIDGKTDLKWDYEAMGSNSTKFDLIKIDESTGVLTVQTGFTGYFAINIIAKDANGNQVSKQQFDVRAESFAPSYIIDTTATTAKYEWFNMRELIVKKPTGADEKAVITCKTDNGIKVSGYKNVGDTDLPSGLIDLNSQDGTITVNVSNTTKLETYKILLNWNSPNSIVYHSVLFIAIG